MAVRSHPRSPLFVYAFIAGFLFSNVLALKYRSSDCTTMDRKGSDDEEQKPEDAYQKAEEATDLGENPYKEGDAEPKVDPTDARLISQQRDNIHQPVGNPDSRGDLAVVDSRGDLEDPQNPPDSQARLVSGVLNLDHQIMVVDSRDEREYPQNPPDIQARLMAIINHWFQVLDDRVGGMRLTEYRNDLWYRILRDPRNSALWCLDLGLVWSVILFWSVILVFCFDYPVMSSS